MYARAAEEATILVGIPKEVHAGERRVAVTPDVVRKLRELGYEVAVQSGAGVEAGFPDAQYTEAGATLEAQARALWGRSDVVVKVRPPTAQEVLLLRDGAKVLSLLFPQRNPDLVRLLRARKATVVALDRVPRITRAQKMDVLSSMANIAGYRAVLEAASHFSGFFGAQVTAAGAMPPARVLVIGAGVAGLAAIAAARNLGAEVRAFDTRRATKEQVESLGGKFLELDFKESGEAAGGYAKEMSKEFIEAEMALFLAQAKEVDVIITTALVAGAKAPTLIKREAVEAMRPGSIVVDLAAEQGGNCELTRADEMVEHRGVKIIGYTDLVSRLANTASRFFAMNTYALLAEMTKEGKLVIDMANDVVGNAAVLVDGEEPTERPPLPVIAETRVRKESRKPPPPEAKPHQDRIMHPNRGAWGTTALGLVLIAGFFILGRFAPAEFLQHSTVFVLACFVGWQVVWSVTPALHTPLMSVTNAISGIIVVGGLLQAGSGQLDLASILGAVAILVAAINIVGGFTVTHRMLRMFRKGG